LDYLDIVLLPSLCCVGDVDAAAVDGPEEVSLPSFDKSFSFIVVVEEFYRLFV
jgi:hypothetical protein